MNPPLVSVIIPNYNHARFLDERILSVLNQTYQNFELIILDDKSTDNSLEVINRYKDNSQVSHIVVNEVNSGSPFKQWQEGIELAKGEWIWIAESDDSCETNMLERLIQILDKKDSCVLAFCRSIIIDNNGEKKGVDKGGKGDNYYISGTEFIKYYMSGECELQNASAAIFKKSIFDKIDDSYSRYKGAGDRRFWIEIAEHGNIAIVDAALNIFRRHKDNSTSRNFLYGINQEEDLKTLNYVVNKKYLSISEARLLTKKYRQKYIYDYTFANKKIKKKIILLWDKGYISFIKHKILNFKYQLNTKIYKILSSH